MDSLSSPIVYPALRLLLVNRLQKAADFREKMLQGTDFFKSEAIAEGASQHVSLASQDISLYRMKEDTQTWYVSAIALKLAQQWQKPAMEIAQALAEGLNWAIEAAGSEAAGLEAANSNITNIEIANPASEPQLLDRIWRHFAIQVTPPGQIHLRLTDRGLAEWLQTLIRYPSTADNLTVDNLWTCSKARNHAIDSGSVRNSTSIFEILYTHARCCSLLRLGEQVGLIRLKAVETSRSTPLWSMVDPEPLLWLNLDHSLRCWHPGDRRLITRLSTTLDELACVIESQDSAHYPNSAYYLKLGQVLSQDFQNFYAACRIFGEIKRTDPALSQVRLGLVLITQWVLRSLLQNFLGIPAPAEL